MMTDQDLIQKLQTLKSVEADQEWLVSARQSMLHVIEAPLKESRNALFSFSFSGFSFRAAVAMAGFLFIGVASGTLALASNSLPGDPLYKVQLAFEGAENALPASPVAQAQRQEATAERRVDELARVTQDLTASSGEGKNIAPAVTKQVGAYKKALAKDSEALSQSGTVQDQSTDHAIEKVKDEANIIQQSAQTLAIVIHQTDNTVDLEKALRATVASRIVSCKDKEMSDQVRKLLSSDEIADLIDANELSVRCAGEN